MIPILLENVPLPPTLRVRRWVDFRNPEAFEQSFVEIVSILRGERIPRGRGGLVPSIPPTENPLNAPVVITSAVEADKIEEKLKEQPKTIRWSIGGKQVAREVTTRDTATRLNSEGTKERFQLGWRHQGVWRKRTTASAWPSMALQDWRWRDNVAGNLNDNRIKISDHP